MKRLLPVASFELDACGSGVCHTFTFAAATSYQSGP
jgi:hypothetical protein